MGAIKQLVDANTDQELVMLQGDIMNENPWDHHSVDVCYYRYNITRTTGECGKEAFTIIMWYG